jgi:hypothetical protein
VAVDYLGYDRAETIAKYRPRSAGQGIEYLLPHVYLPLYLREIERIQQQLPPPGGLGIVEFGAGAAMNSLALLEELHAREIPVREAYATDFSPDMVEAAKEDARQLPEEVVAPFDSFVATNESLLEGLARGLGEPADRLHARFHLVFGVNTFRFSWRSSQAQQVFDMLVPGGAVVMIDMNNRHPYLLGPLVARVRGRAPVHGRKSGLLRDLRAIYAHERTVLPTLAQYTEPWRAAGFTVVESTTFSWMPHSARGLRFAAMRTMSPILDAVAGGFAMRALVIARKPLACST